METKIHDFQNPRDLRQAANIMFATSVIMQIALGQVCGCNALTGKTVFDAKKGPKVVPDFQKVMGYLSTAFKAFNDAAFELEKNDDKK